MVWDDFVRKHRDSVEEIISGCGTAEGQDAAISLMREASEFSVVDEALETIDHIVRLAAGNRSLTGTVHTRSEDARFMCGLALEEYVHTTASKPPPVILDPACGSGVFLVEALRESSKVFDVDAADYASRYLYGADVSPLAVEATRLSLSLAAGVPVQDSLLAPNVICADSLLDSIPSADIVIGNPPYVRNRCFSSGYRERLLANLSSCYPGSLISELSASCDLYVYFILRGLALLHENGVLCFLVPNVWLESVYGQGLRRILSRSAHISGIYEYRESRRFNDASINSCILLAVKKEPAVDASMRFVSLSASGESASSGLDGIAVKQSEALESPFGGLLLRSPDIGRVVVEKVREHLIPLDGICIIHRGMTTGANDFFYPSSERIAEFGIEPEFLIPCIKKPQECKRIVIDKPGSVVFECRERREELRGTGAGRYIDWGESQRFHLRPSCAIRPRWWTLQDHKPADIVWIKAIDRVHRHCRLRYPVPVDQRLYAINSDDPAALNLILNSTMVCFLREVYGRTSLGEGALDSAVADVKLLRVPSPEIIPPGTANGLESRLASRDILPIPEEMYMPDRMDLDALVFEALGISNSEADAIREELARLVETRLSRAKRLPN